MKTLSILLVICCNTQALKLVANMFIAFLTAYDP